MLPEWTSVRRRISVLERGGGNVRETQAKDLALSGPDSYRIVRRCLCSCPVRIYGAVIAVHDVVVDSVFYVGRGIRRSEQTLIVRLVLCKEKLRIAVAIEEPRFQLRLRRLDDLRFL